MKSVLGKDLAAYFEGRRGTGVLATADASGRVNAALYARPHILGGRRVAFIMADRLTRANLRSNPRAAYLFVERGPGWRGVRLHLEMTGEERDSPRIARLRRRRIPPGEVSGPRYLVTFRVVRVLPLLGGGGRARTLPDAFTTRK
ncbi:MAG: pyridoxamine 5'-phosphate oxidase family protein [bacterium]|nr:pyridoxamine 5'-phosphate oxidase family protein [bacterium]